MKGSWLSGGVARSTLRDEAIYCHVIGDYSLVHRLAITYKNYRDTESRSLSFPCLRVSVVNFRGINFCERTASKTRPYSKQQESLRQIEYFPHYIKTRRQARER